MTPVDLSITFIPKLPITKAYIVDYYDGELEGLAASSTVNKFFYFRKVWWVEGSVPRLYRVCEINSGDLPVNENVLLSNLMEGGDELKFLDPYPEYKDEFERFLRILSNDQICQRKYYAFCSTIFGEIAVSRERD